MVIIILISASSKLYNAKIKYPQGTGIILKELWHGDNPIPPDKDRIKDKRLKRKNIKYKYVRIKYVGYEPPNEEHTFGRHTFEIEYWITSSSFFLIIVKLLKESLKENHQPADR